MSKHVHYHQEAREPVTFAILKTHDDGTVDIGPEGGAAVVTKCKIEKAAVIGSATHITRAEEKEEKAADEADEKASKKK